MKTILTYKESQHLKELGVEPQLARVCAEDVPYDEKPEWGDPNMIDILESQCVFSLESLLSILPKKVSDRQRIYELQIDVDHYSDAWCVQYTHNTDVNNLEDSFQSAEELCDAIYAEIVWLKENPELVWL